ncbi:MAG: carboxypeptidase M32 [Clostridia bacterium]|nr:carboxypeptidase M32 [Clostridia bacterium]
MTHEEALLKFKSYERASFALGHAAGVISYDGATVAPKGGCDVREMTTGELSRMSYELTTAGSTVEAVETLAADPGKLDPVMRRKVTEFKRKHDRIKRVPVEEYVAYTGLCSKSYDVWQTAKNKNDFAMFLPYLEKVFADAKRILKYMEPELDEYDAALDSFERGLRKETCDAFFASLRKKLAPLIKGVVEHASAVDDTPLHGKFPIEIQRRFSDFVMELMGIDRDHCIIGEVEHPFTTDFSKYDVRITTHYYEDAVASSLYSVIHEGGHALYELHTADELAFSELGTGVSMAIHESQSRFYENIIGRSREFCGLTFPWLKKNFAPRLDGVSGEDFYRMINKSAPSLIRTEADELTYCMHVMIRYELEKAVFDGALKVSELPGEWNGMYKEYLGVDVPDDRRGVLQDSHWSGGGIGYFPSYAIGSAYGAQYLREMQKEFDVFGAVRANDIKKINGWLCEHIWKYGCMKDPVELFESVCGRFDPSYYTDYLGRKFGEIYGI